jgi:AraC family transcriptional regulator
MLREELSDPILLSRIDKVYDYVQDHLSGDLSVNRLAEVAIMSPRWFQRNFLSITKEPPAQFVRRVRIENAANLLSLQNNSSIGNIAHDCGFGSAELLTRHFKNHFRMTPSEWRKTYVINGQNSNRQIQDINREALVIDASAGGPFDVDMFDRKPNGMGAALHLEKLPERRLIYTRHFRGYDSSVADAFIRLKNWAEPRGLINDQTITIGMGLDNPRVTLPENCRFLACLTVQGDQEVGSGIGKRLMPAGLYATMEFDGLWSELPLVLSKFFYLWLSRSGVEAVSHCTYLEYLAIPLDLKSLHCKIALQVRSL